MNNVSDNTPALFNIVWKSGKGRKTGPHFLQMSFSPNFKQFDLKPIKTLILTQEEEHSKLKESNRQLVAVAKGLAGALLVVGVGPILAIISKHRKHSFQVKCLGGKCRASMISDIWNQEKNFRVLLLRQNYGMVGEQEAWQPTLSVSTLSPGKNWFKEFLEDPPCDTHVKLTTLFVF